MFENSPIAIRELNPLLEDNLGSPVTSGFVLQASKDCCRFSLRISLEQLPKAAKSFGLDISPTIGFMTKNETKTALCLGPDEWLLLAPTQENASISQRFNKLGRTDELGQAIAHSLVDVSHRTLGIEVLGPAASYVINSGCPLDLDKMDVGRCTRSILDKAEIILMKLDEQHYRLEILRSFAPFVWKFLSVAGRDFEI